MKPGGPKNIVASIQARLVQRSHEFDVEHQLTLSDLAGVHFVDLDDEPATRNDLATRLETAGCAVNKAGGDWLKVGKFKVRGD